VLGWTDTDSQWADWLMEKLVVVLEDQFEGGEEEDLIGALEDLSEEKAVSFNAETPDADGVFYQSWAGARVPLRSGRPMWRRSAATCSRRSRTSSGSAMTAWRRCSCRSRP
jgi:hypothetical protein